MATLAKEIVLDLVAGTLEVDGTSFPWLVEDNLEIKTRTHTMPTLMLAIPAELIRVVGTV